MRGLASLSFSLTAARLFGAVAAFLTTLLLTREFGAETAAAFAVCLAMAATLSTFGLAGVQALAPMLTAEYTKTEKFGHLRGFVTAAGLFSLLLTGLLAAVIFAAAEFGLLARLGLDVDPITVVAACVIAVFMTLSAFAAGILAGRHKQKKAQLPESLLRPILVLTLIAVLAFVVTNAGTSDVLLSVVSAFVVSALTVSVLLWREFKSIPQAHIALDIRRWSRAAPSWLAISLAWDNMIELFLLVAAALAGPTETLLLFICFRFRMLLGFGVRSIYSISQPRIYEALAVDDKTAVRSVITVTNLLSTGYALAAFAFVIVFSEQLLGLFGEAFTDGHWTLVCVCGLIVVRALLGPNLAVLAGLGRHNQIAVVLLGWLAVALALCVPLYASLGILGFGVSYLLANSAAAVMLWWLARRQTGIDSAVWAGEWKMTPASMLGSLRHFNAHAKP